MIRIYRKRIVKSEKEENLPVKIAKLKNHLEEDFDEIEELKKDPDVIDYFSSNREV